MADIKLLLVEDDKNLAFMEKNTLEDIVVNTGAGHYGMSSGVGVSALVNVSESVPQVREPVSAGSLFSITGNNPSQSVLCQ